MSVTPVLLPVMTRLVSCEEGLLLYKLASLFFQYDMKLSIGYCTMYD